MNLIFNGVRETIKIKANKAIIYRLDSVVLWGNSWWGLSGAREEHGWNLKMFSRGGVIHWQGDSWSWTWKQRGRQLCCIWGRGVSNNDAGTKLLKQKGIWHVVRQEKKEQCGGQCVWSKASRWGEEKCKLTQQDKGGEGGSILQCLTHWCFRRDRLRLWLLIRAPSGPAVSLQHPSWVTGWRRGGGRAGPSPVRHIPRVRHVMNNHM